MLQVVASFNNLNIGFSDDRSLPAVIITSIAFHGVDNDLCVAFVSSGFGFQARRVPQSGPGLCYHRRLPGSWQVRSPQVKTVGEGVIPCRVI
ncbi:MAG: hypothetical protein CMJ65_11655 [Planctomycetaceae bacterium]|nr:hypothetical protein [Planctomycetaceae bacterium]